MAKIDWSKAGVRIRRTPNEHGRNPDWNDRLSRWKVAEEYAGETLATDEVRLLAPCEICAAPVGEHCADSAGRCMDDGPHPERRFAAGAALIAAGWKL
jgi:hypothetical protein